MLIEIKCIKYINDRILFRIILMIQLAIMNQHTIYEIIVWQFTFHHKSEKKKKKKNLIYSRHNGITFRLL